jgi:hypothetical protein
MNITKIHNKIIYLLLLFIVSITVACTSIPDNKKRVLLAQNTATTHRFEAGYITNGMTSIFNAHRIQDNSKKTNIYIECDGFAYLTSYQASPDPTPLKPVLLSLAVIDPSPNVIYIGRPCQYDKTGCAVSDWTVNRFSEKNAITINTAIDTLKKTYNLNQIELIGYSGGAFFASNLAAKRTDVTGLRTVAGNLNLEYFSQFHQIDKFQHLNLTSTEQLTLRDTPQLHLVSQSDPIVPPALVQHYLNTLQSPLARMVVVTTPTHSDGWDTVWPKFITTPLPPIKQ